MNTDGNSYEINEMLARMEADDAQREYEEMAEELEKVTEKVDELTAQNVEYKDKLDTIYEHILTPEQKEKLAYDFLIDHGKGG